MGSPGDEVGRNGDEVLHRRLIDRSFCIATRKVTVEEFRQFRPAHPVDLRVNPSPQGPVVQVTWYDAAAYCNWLSAWEGIPQDQWCYLPNEDGQYAEGMRMRPDYLSRTGYRLPTEAEWEYACRAGAVTSHAWGGLQCVQGYAVYRDNSAGRAAPAGLLKPNELGLFDMEGNAREWCLDAYGTYRILPGGRATPDSPPRGCRDGRVVRGGSYLCPACLVRCAARSPLLPGQAAPDVGFRVVRTLPP